MNFVDWGLIPYNDAARRQLDLVDQVARGDVQDTLVFCTHPPVVTTGRATKPEDIIGWRGEVVEVSRGGRATYHGPSQVIVYPILDLNLNRAAFRARDLHGYMRALEAAMVQTLREFKIEAQGSASALNDDARVHSTQAEKRDEVSRTGVWFAKGDKKIASIGIACKKWVSYHGLALNVSHDSTAFLGIQPCGMNSSVMTSMELLLGRSVDRASVIQSLHRSLADLLATRV